MRLPSLRAVESSNYSIDSLEGHAYSRETADFRGAFQRTWRRRSRRKALADAKIALPRESCALRGSMAVTTPRGTNSHSPREYSLPRSVTMNTFSRAHLTDDALHHELIAR